jgi:hypothetical protein
MEDNINDLLTQARENISDSVDKQQEEVYLHALRESLYELVNLEILNNKYLEVRNQAINNLYNECGYSAIQLGDIVGISRQMIHNIVK